ncbi:hypothetical protein FKM82_014786 [Ascaphus truei]
MLRVVILSALLALTLAHGGGKGIYDSSSAEEVGEKRGHCPRDILNNSFLAPCPTSCPNGANCSALNCSSDTNCTGVQKCCKSSCGLKCMDPEYKTVCREDDDCAGTLICCRKSCVTVCVTPKPASLPNKNRKGPKGRSK